MLVLTTAIAVGYVTPVFLYLCRRFIGHVGFTRHDWGSQLAYEAARERPDVFTGVIGITIPVSFSPQFLRYARSEG
jgi:hypothetical protein